MEVSVSKHAAGGLRGAPRRRTALALAAALFSASLLVDVGIARAEYPEGWVEDPDLQAIGACLGTCGSLFIIKGQLFKYAAGASCVGCLYDIAVSLYHFMDEVESDCWTGVLGMPCGGPYTPPWDRG